ncbi:hypothetical protein AN189_10440 [Loktanella sp. 3ANDIMAR09]|uniref:hypothetical protein n=1 Tax=Loktanella sp. 3ANDIMAR09 TaxID=1225657 RepID=UPI0006F6ECB6|nr:hypothetical protein [Loktanella sp. 3ANDIMAR09]KQI68242.1 hypothetical protein AN189_10440 [Loktanella sp. 3ANDIMAR09]
MTLTIPDDDHGQIRIFAVTPPADPALLEADPAAIAKALGTDALNLDFVDVIDTRNLAGLSLLDYLHQGYDVPSDLADDAALRDISGPVILVMSRASWGQKVTLNPAPGVRHVTTLGEPARLRPPVSPIASAGATGAIPPGKAPPSNAAMSGRVATLALLVLFALVAVMIWVAS